MRAMWCNENNTTTKKDFSKLTYNFYTNIGGIENFSVSKAFNTEHKEKLSIVAWKKAFSFTNDLETAVESRKHDISARAR